MKERSGGSSFATVYSVQQILISLPFFFFPILRSLIHDSCKLLKTEHKVANVCSRFVSIGRSFRANQS